MWLTLWTTCRWRICSWRFESREIPERRVVTCCVSPVRVCLPPVLRVLSCAVLSVAALVACRPKRGPWPARPGTGERQRWLGRAGSTACHCIYLNGRLKRFRRRRARQQPGWGPGSIALDCEPSRRHSLGPFGADPPSRSIAASSARCEMRDGRKRLLDAGDGELSE